MSIVIKGGTVVTADIGFAADVLVADGAIKADERSAADMPVGP